MRTNLKEAWNADGYVKLTGFMEPSECRRYQAICDDIYDQWRITNTPGFSTNIAYLTDERYFSSNPLPLIDLLNLIGSERVTLPLNTVARETVRFHNTQYFVEQKSTKSPCLGPGAWHRDTQFEAPDLMLERSRMEGPQSAHFRIAFQDDDNLEIIPGSAFRWDSGEELAIRRPANTDVWARTAQTTSPEMPGARRIGLKAGDALIFHAWSIHRGHYNIAPKRRTLDVIYS